MTNATRMQKTSKTMIPTWKSSCSNRTPRSSTLRRPRRTSGRARQRPAVMMTMVSAHPHSQGQGPLSPLLQCGSTCLRQRSRLLWELTVRISQHGAVGCSDRATSQARPGPGPPSTETAAAGRSEDESGPFCPLVVFVCSLLLFYKLKMVGR